MIVKKKEDVTIVFNDKESFLVMSNLDSKIDIPIITIGGWFGEKLYELLKSDGDLEKFFKIESFTHDNKLQETFKRLLVTLIQQNLINVSPDNGLTHLRPFSEKEYADFSCGDFTGSLSIKQLDNELFASAQCATAGGVYRNAPELDTTSCFAFECNEGGIDYVCFGT